MRGVQTRAESLDLRAAEPSVPALPSRVAFDALYREHADFVFRSLRRLGVHEAALDDALQEVFIVVHRRFSELRPGPTQRAWLFAIAQRVASSQRRWMRRKGHALSLDEELAPTEADSPLEGAMRREASHLMADFLDTLDEPRRAAFVAADLEQMTGAEAHAALGVNQNTLYYRLTSARKAFAAFLVARGVTRQRGDAP